MNKKDLEKASEAAVNKFFSKSEEITPNSPDDNTNDTNITKHTNNTKRTKHTHVTNKSKHYDERGKRETRYGLLLDKKLKEDLIQICSAKGNRSMNDYIVTLLIEHIEQSENQKLLEEYKKLNNNKK